METPQGEKRLTSFFRTGGRKGMNLNESTDRNDSIKDLYNIFNTMGPYDVLDYLDSVWKQTTNDQVSIDNFENHLLAVAVYFDFDQSWLNQYSLSVLPSWWWFNSTNKKRPYRNRDLESLRYNYFRLYIVSLMDN